MRVGQFAAWEFDVASSRHSWDPQMAELVSLSSAELETVMQCGLGWVHPDDQLRAAQAFAAAHAREAYRARVGEALRRAASPAEAEVAACRLLGEHLQ